MTRPTLSVRNPKVDALFAELPVDPDDELRRWATAFLRARDAWSDLNRSGRRYSDVETARWESRRHG